MASVNGASSSFSAQKNLANKKHKDLTDQEKIYLLKQEIDNLRGQVNGKEHDPYGWKSQEVSGNNDADATLQSPVYQSIPTKDSGLSSSTFCGSGACLRVPILTMLLLATLMWVVSKVRRNARVKSSSFRPLRTAQAAWEGSQFELQEQVLGMSDNNNITTFIPSISLTSREDASAKFSYEAPKNELEVRFV